MKQDGHDHDPREPGTGPAGRTRVGNDVRSGFFNDRSTLTAGPARTAPGPDGSAREGLAGRVPQRSIPFVLSFDIEEHHRIEAAIGLDVPGTLKDDYHRRMCWATGWILEQLAERGITATFFIIGEIARQSPGLIRSIHEAGHEVASHGWNHSRLHTMSPEEFREDVLRSKDALEQASGTAVVGFRAPTFSLVRKTAWAWMSWPRRECSTIRPFIPFAMIATAFQTHPRAVSCPGKPTPDPRASSGNHSPRRYERAGWWRGILSASAHEALEAGTRTFAA